MILGDNLFFGYGFFEYFVVVVVQVEGGMVFGYCVIDFECYGVVDIGVDGKVIVIIEKFEVVLLFYVVIGLYFFDGIVLVKVKLVKFFVCGEFEIIFFLEFYLKEGFLIVQ